MGRTILCNNCKSTFNEDILAGRENPDICPVCAKSLVEDDDLGGVDCNKAELSFGDGVELGEYDSFDEDKIDFWWYAIDEPGESGRGLTHCNCAKCGYPSGAFTYPIAKTGNHVLISPKAKKTCSKCGNEMKNHILSKRPLNWVDPRKNEMWGKDYNSMPKCPVCSSVKIHKISMTNKAASAMVFGIFAVGHVSKTYQCDICKAKF